MKRASQIPQSVFNTRSADLVEFLETEHMKDTDKDKGKKDSSLYSHQIDAVLELRRYFAPRAQSNPSDSNIALVVLPTGCGKTGVAVLASYALSASRVLVITPSVIISRQIAAAYGYREVSNQNKIFLLTSKIIKLEDAQNTLPTVSLIKKSTEIREGMRSMVMVVNAHKIGGQSSVGIDQIPCEGYDLVIVDEAHHYPADTWRLLVEHFCKSRRLFLTATPLHKGRPILPGIPPCYELKRSEAIKRGIIRDVKFDDGVARGVVDERQRYQAIAERMEYYLDDHDEKDSTINHQGMVLTQTKQGINPAETFCDIYNELFPNKCAVYVSETRRDILDDFLSGKIRVLVIIGWLLEGFDHNPVSVLGIVRNIAPTSRVLFAQFVGRAVRKNGPNDPVSAQIVTHECFNQRQNFDTFEQLPEEEPTDDND